ncbi:ABC transporter substrate-binding protein [Shewanella algicola]|uniref:ABC transporter substrate-binding protein n=1 Tax=Shewanella algicola TaxID=640633 RepID=UPI00249566DB|nr:helical backbone metal receptor [Shewanella algicola]
MKHFTKPIYVAIWAIFTSFLLVAQVAAAERIVSLAPNWSHTVSSLGAENELVGVTRYARFPQSLPDKIARGELPVVGGFTDIDIEKVISLNPSLVLTATGLQLNLKRELEKRGVKVIHMQESSLDEVYRGIDALGQTINRAEASNLLISKIKSQLDTIEQQYANLPKVKVYYEINYFYKCVPGADSYITELIKIAGGEPVFAERSGIAPMVTWDEIVNQNPDFILLPMWPGATGPVFSGTEAGSGTTTIDEVRGRVNADKVTAVIKQQVKFIDSAVTKQAGPNIPNAARLLAEAIHGH